MRTRGLLWLALMVPFLALGQASQGPATVVYPTTAGNCVKIAAQGGGYLADSGSACGGGGGAVTSVQCGTGLSGGTITTTGVCAVLYGTSASTAAQGNDTRFPASVTGLRKGAGAGSADVAATAGTDYVLPSGNVATATALAANPTDCSSNQYAIAIDAGGNLTCAAISSGQVSGLGTAAAQNTGTSGANLGLLNGSNTESGNDVFSAAGAASSPALLVNGAPFAGTGTTSWPQLLIQPSGTTSTTWNTAGTYLGVNAASGFTGRILDIQLNGTSRITVSSAGLLSAGLGFTCTGGSCTLGSSTSNVSISHNAGGGTVVIGDGTTTGQVSIGGGSNDVSVGSHLATTGTTPGTPTSCGTGSPTVAGDDVAGSITTGTGATACTMAFAATFTTTPKSAVCSSNNAAVGCAVTSLSATSVTFGLTTALSGTIYYWVTK